MSGSATATSTWAGAETEATGATEAGAETAGSAWAEAAAETTLGAGVLEVATFGDVLTDMVAEITTGIAAVFVQGAAVDRTTESETEGTAWGCEWGSHGVLLSIGRKHDLRFRYVDDISETIVMQPFDAYLWSGDPEAPSLSMPASRSRAHSASITALRSPNSRAARA